MAKGGIRNSRQDQVLEAVRACIVEYGLAGTTLERIAEKSGLTRPLVPHHMGNRQDIPEAAIDRSFDSCIRRAREFEELSGQERFEAWLDSSVYPVDLPPEAMIVFDELIAWSHHDERVRARIHKGYEFLHSFLDDALAEIHPEADPKQRRDVVVGIAHIGDQAERWAVLDVADVEQARRDARAAGERLAATLAESTGAGPRSTPPAPAGDV